jgi:hypothetical protein
MITETLLKKIVITLVIIILGFLSISIFRVFAEMKKADVLLDYYIDKTKRESDSIIKLKNERIKKLLSDIYVLNGKINAAHSKIDSLNAQKQRIQYVYINKIKEIDNYNAKQLEEYWKNEIK